MITRLKDAPVSGPFLKRGMGFEPTTLGLGSCESGKTAENE